MLSEPVNVLAVEGDMVHVQTSRKASCSKCSLKGGCGQYLLGRDKDSLWLSPGASGGIGALVQGQEKRMQDSKAPGQTGQHEPPFIPGARALLRLDGEAVTKLALLFYLLPLGTLLLFTLIANAVSSSEAWLILSALAGLIIGFALLPPALRLLSDSCRPVLLSTDAAESILEFHDES